MGSQLTPAKAPWDDVSAQEQLFVLITGANGGIGLSIGERLIDEFLATRSLRSHLILIPTTRSKSKSLQTIKALRDHARNTAQTSTSLRSRVGSSYRWQDTVARIHVLSLQLDLCDLRGVYAFANALVRGTVSNPEGLDDEYLRNVRIPRLDSVVFNAAYGGWSGVNWPKAVWTILTEGLVQSVTWPNFKMALPTARLNDRSNYNYPSEPLLGEVFTACVFGHYILAHELLPLLGRRSESETPGRLVWSSSLEAVGRVLDMSDFQAFNGDGPYESAKRLTDILSITATLPAAIPSSNRFFTPDDPTEAREKPIRPRMYLTHPGIVTSTLFPVPWFLMWAYELALVISRWIGSPWHSVDSYTGAKSPVWITLQEQSALDELDAERIKWGSSSNRHLEVDVKKSEVEGWGWEGKVENAKTLEADTAVGVLKKTIGRKRGASYVTKDDIARFEELGAECWKKMENLRYEWENILEVKKA
ncbi:3-keto-steroid reductase [Fusarium torreyae]|uniref:3-keto-steroid reductase n=1 Tax=Fusarium torreyae TaxID=1237075 RepID=A0A9W8VI34_9HYPO|nr:3-keto-steroid reductase [Fusarium torreyae]